MKISKSKKELARIISENGGWRDGAESAAQSSSDNAVSFYLDTASRFCDRWYGKHMIDGDIEQDGLISNWHQTVLSRAEYLHLYPAPDADGWIEWEGGECPVGENISGDIKLACGEKFDTVDVAMWNWSLARDNPRSIIAYRLHKPEQAKPEFCKSVMRTIPEPEAKPTIEQLAADYRSAKDYAERKQQEADDAKADADSKLKALELAGEALGLIVSPITEKQEPELVITDWRDLQVGDEIEYLSGKRTEMAGRVMTVKSIDPTCNYGLHVHLGDNVWPAKWRFIRRP